MRMRGPLVHASRKYRQKFTGNMDKEREREIKTKINEKGKGKNTENSKRKKKRKKERKGTNVYLETNLWSLKRNTIQNRCV